MSARTQIAIGNILLGFGAGALFPIRVAIAVAFAIQLIGLGLIVFHTEREVRARVSVDNTGDTTASEEAPDA